MVPTEVICNNLYRKCVPQFGIGVWAFENMKVNHLFLEKQGISCLHEQLRCTKCYGILLRGVKEAIYFEY
jgi:hypothetical protein